MVDKNIRIKVTQSNKKKIDEENVLQRFLKEKELSVKVLSLAVSPRLFRSSTVTVLVSKVG